MSSPTEITNPSARLVPSSALIDEDPRETLQRLIGSEETRLLRRRNELAEARNALARLDDIGVPRDAPAMVPVTVEVAPSLVRSLIDDTTGPIRNAAISVIVGSAVDRDLLAHAQEAIRAGREQRSVYDDSVLNCPRGMEEIDSWARAGERQRLCSGVPSEFAVYGDAAVVAVGTWGDPEADYVAIREPMLIQAFTALFDRLWDASYPFPAARGTSAEEDAPLLDLLGRGFKDEAIARYLGWSLRTVRRRVARLMEELGADTRFQLGAEAARDGRLDTIEASRPGRDAQRGRDPQAYQDQRRAVARLGSRERGG